MEAQATSPTRGAPRVLRNATLLVIAQVLGAPLSMLVNAVAARALGAAEYGRYYQVLTFAGFAFLFVEWGQPNVLSGKIATHRAAAGELLGSAIVFRLCASFLVLLLVPGVCALAGYDRDFLTLLALAVLGSTVATVSGACQDALRGYERTDFAAASYVGWQILSAAAVVPTLLLGGGIRGLLIAQIVCAAAGAAFVLKMMPRMRVPPLSARLATLRELFFSGRAFLMFALVLALQPMIDAAMLSAFSAPEGMGWYAAARKLIGVLTFPASALIVALYPTLCRLRAEDAAGFRSTAADALYAVAIVVVPVALGCGLFPDLGVAIFGQSAYGPAADDLRLLAVYLFLVYFSMPLGSCLMASGRQVAWTLLQFMCVAISVLLDPPLIHWFQTRAGNGGLGVCLAGVISEIVMVVGGIWLLPSGILGRIPRSKISSALLSGVVMVLVAVLSSGLDTLMRAVLAVLAYFACLQLSGGVNLLQLRSFAGMLRSR